MTDDRHQPDDVSAMAAEHALGLLSAEDGAPRLPAKRRTRKSRRRSRRWRGRVRRCTTKTNSVAPPAVSGRDRGGDRRQRGGQRQCRRPADPAEHLAVGNGCNDGDAAGLALVLLYQPHPAPSPGNTAAQRAPATPMVAMLGGKTSDEGRCELGTGRAAACARGGWGHARRPGPCA